jgi:hypothetical protein
MMSLIVRSFSKLLIIKSFGGVRGAKSQSRTQTITEKAFDLPVVRSQNTIWNHQQSALKRIKSMNKRAGERGR